MAGYLLKRVLQLVPVLLVIVCVNFFIIHLAPGDPIIYLIGDAPVEPANSSTSCARNTASTSRSGSSS